MHSHDGIRHDFCYFGISHSSLISLFIRFSRSLILNLIHDLAHVALQFSGVLQISFEPSLSETLPYLFLNICLGTFLQSLESGGIVLHTLLNECFSDVGLDE